MQTPALLVFSLVLTYPAYASSQTSQVADRTLEAAILLAGVKTAGLPIVLAPASPAQASRGVEGWTLRTQDEHAERIIVNSESDVFRCAGDRDGQDDRCLLKLASIIIHEAWHYRHGLDEAGAYDAQIAFLTTHGGSGSQISCVWLARDHVLANRRAIERRRK